MLNLQDYNHSQDAAEVVNVKNYLLEQICYLFVWWFRTKLLPLQCSLKQAFYEVFRILPTD